MGARKKRMPDSWDGIKQLACAVILKAVNDHRRQVAQGGVSKGRRRQRKSSARAFLSGLTPGPGKMSMRKFCCQPAEIDEAALEDAALKHKTTFHRRPYHA